MTHIQIASDIPSSNFNFLKDWQPSFAEYLYKAEQNIYDNPRSAIIQTDMVAKLLTRHLASKFNLLKKNDTIHQSALLNKLQTYFTESYNNAPQVKKDFDNLWKDLHLIRRYRNNAVHFSNDLTTKDALIALEASYRVAIFLYQGFHNIDYQPKKFHNPPRHKSNATPLLTPDDAIRICQETSQKDETLKSNKNANNYALLSDFYNDIFSQKTTSPEVKKGKEILLTEDPPKTMEDELHILNEVLETPVTSKKKKSIKLLTTDETADNKNYLTPDPSKIDEKELDEIINEIKSGNIKIPYDNQQTSDMKNQTPQNDKNSTQLKTMKTLLRDLEKKAEKAADNLRDLEKSIRTLAHFIEDQ